MGVRGLTSYIYYRENIYFEDILLKDCALIVDGNSLVPHLYNSNLIHTSAFGGDYDKLGEAVEKFFKRLIFNNVYPIVVFDGAVERRKVTTVRIRARNKVSSLQAVTPSNYNGQCFPLFMRKVMREKLLDMGILVLQTDLEADSEIAALAKIYKAPVLSNDSDYFIFDVLYIPIPKLQYSNATNSEIRCKMFRMDKFLRHLDLDSSKLPLLAVILGNDYIPRSEFSPFLGQIKLDKCRSSGYCQSVVAGVLRWLKSESVESALQKILSCMRVRGRESLRQKIIKIMRSYTNLTTVLVNYIPDDPKAKAYLGSSETCLEDDVSKLLLDVLVEKVSDSESEGEDQTDVAGLQEDKGSSSDVISYYSSEDNDVECDGVNVAEVKEIITEGQKMELGLSNSVFPEWFKHMSRKGLVNADILTMLNLKMFFSTPQPECYEMSYSGEPYTHILQCVGGLLLGKAEIQYWHRQHKKKYERTSVETVCCTDSYGTFPSLEHIGTLSLVERQTILNEIMNADESILKLVPNEWKLYFIAVGYWLQNDMNNEIKQHHLHSVIMMMITLLIIDDKLGFHRQRKSFIKTYGAAIGKISKSRGTMRTPFYTVMDNLTEGLQKVKKEDCIFIFDDLLPHFQVDRQTQHSRHFSNSVVHSFARLQHCLNFTSLLNSVLSFPYPDIKIHSFYNGTFLYNVAGNLKKRSNILSYVDSFFMKAPTLLSVYRKIYEIFRKSCPESMNKKPKKKTRKPKTNPSTSEKDNELVKFDSDSEPFFDKNNRFSVIFG